MSNNRVTQLLLAVLTGLFAIYLYINMELVEVPDYSNSLDELQGQPFLAMQKLLEQRGGEVVQAEDYRSLFDKMGSLETPQDSDAIVLSESDVAISQKLSDSLLDWVERGGYLIVATTSSGSEADYRANSLLNTLGIDVYWLNDLDGDFALNTYDNTPTSITTDLDYSIEVNLETEYRISVPEGQELHYTAGDEEGYTFVQLQRGQGYITLLTDVEIWNNFQITDYDNVLLLTSLLGDIDIVYMMVPKERAHWFTLLFTFAPYFIVIGIALMFAVMWRKAVRFGAVQHIAGKENVVFSQHIKAAGQFYWDNKQQKVLLDSVRLSILQALIRRWPTVNLADQKRQIHLLSELSGWSKEVIQELVFGNTPQSEAQFTKRVTGLQQLRNML